MARVVGYARVSTEIQAAEGVSLDAQRAKIAAWCTANDGELAGLYVDAGLSGGRADNRPELQAALLDVTRDGGILVVYSLSRLARSTKDTIAIAERLKAGRAHLVSLSEKIDTTSASGKMIFRLFAVLAEFERDLISERTRGAMAHKRSKRERIGQVPFGSRLGEDGRALGDDPRALAAIAEIRHLRSLGWSLRRIARELDLRNVPTQNGSPRWSHNSVASILAREPARHEPDRPTEEGPRPPAPPPHAGAPLAVGPAA